MDVLDEILGSLRLTGGVVVDGGFTGDFCVLAQFTPDHFAPFFAMPDRLISYRSLSGMPVSLTPAWVLWRMFVEISRGVRPSIMRAISSRTDGGSHAR